MPIFFLTSDITNLMNFADIQSGVEYNLKTVLEDDDPIAYLGGVAMGTHWDDVYGLEGTGNGVVEIRKFLDDRNALYHFVYQSAYTVTPPTLWKTALLVVNDDNIAFECRLATSAEVRPADWCLVDQYPELYTTLGAVFPDPAVHDRVVLRRAGRSDSNPTEGAENGQAT